MGAAMPPASRLLAPAGRPPAGWDGETATRTGTATSTLRERTPTHGELYAYPVASNWSLEDIFFNVGDWLAQEVAQAFAVEEGDAVIRGNGTSKPTGMSNTPAVATGDFAPPPALDPLFPDVYAEMPSHIREQQEFLVAMEGGKVREDTSGAAFPL